MSYLSDKDRAPLDRQDIKWFTLRSFPRTLLADSLSFFHLRETKTFDQGHVQIFLVVIITVPELHLDITPDICSVRPTGFNLSLLLYLHPFPMSHSPFQVL